MAHKVIHTSATHAGFVRDVTDRLPGTKWQRPLPGDFIVYMGKMQLICVVKWKACH